jgi:NAD(P)-dependent dehydrogenase (short-subunit alcohol dehydrogenase family)
MAAYGRSKLANLLFTLELAERLRGSGVTVNAVHPGVVRTEFAGKDDVGKLFGALVKLSGLFMLSPEQGARTTVYVATSPELEGVSGRYFARSQRKQPRKSGARPRRGASAVAAQRGADRRDLRIKRMMRVRASIFWASLRLPGAGNLVLATASARHLPSASVVGGVAFLTTPSLPRS